MVRQAWTGCRQLPGVDKSARQIGDRSYESENLYMLAYACCGDRGIGDYDLGRRSVNEALEISREARMDGHTAPALLVAGQFMAGSAITNRVLNLCTMPSPGARTWGSSAFKRTLTIIYASCTGKLISMIKPGRLMATRGLRIATEHQIGFNLLSLQAEVAIAQLFLGDLDVKQQLLDSYEKARPQGQWMQWTEMPGGII